MTLTGLEVVLGGFALTVLAGLVTWIVTNARYQTKACCDERYGIACNAVQEVKNVQERDSGLALRMLREVIMHLPITDEAKADILNDRRSK